MTYTEYRVFRLDTTKPIAAIVCAKADVPMVQMYAENGVIVHVDKYCPPGFAWAFAKDEWERLNTEAA